MEAQFVAPTSGKKFVPACFLKKHKIEKPGKVILYYA